MRVIARGFGLAGTLLIAVALALPSTASAATAPGHVRNLTVAVTAIDRGNGQATLSVAFDAANTGGPTDHYQVDECVVPAGALNCSAGFTSLPDVPAGPAHVVVPGPLTCPPAASTCFIRVRGVDATNTQFSSSSLADAEPWAPYAVSAASGPAADEVTLTFDGPSETGRPGARHYVAYVCTTGCASDANWSDSGLSIPFPASGSGPFTAPPYDCGPDVTCNFRMQFVDGSAAVSALSGAASAVGPVLTIDGPAPGAVTNDPTVDGTCTIGLGTVTATVNPGSNTFAAGCSATGTWSISIASLPDGNYSVSASQAGSPLAPAGPVSFTYDSTAPVTTDNTAAIGSGWHTAPVTVTLSPSDNLSGVVATYSTTNGTTPTTSSASGTSISLATDGVFTIKYFSVDAAGNAETVKTGSTQIRVDQTAPVVTITPANGVRVGHDRYLAECATPGICGSVTDATSGVASFVPATVQRLSDGFYWNGSSFRPPVANAPVTGTAASFSIALAPGRLADGTSYKVTIHATDVAGNAVNATSTFVYDNTKPTPVSVATANHNGAVGVGDSFAVTFSEPIDPASATGASTLTFTRTGSGTTKYAISGLTNAALTTGSTGYVSAASGTRTVTYNGVLGVSGSTVTFTVTTACTSGCAFATGGAPAGSFAYKADSSISDSAGNGATTTTITTGPIVLF